MDAYIGTDPGSFITFFTFLNIVVFDMFLYFPWNDSWILMKKEIRHI